MKEIRTVKMVEQIDVKFVADDGKEFVGINAEQMCRDYERQKDETKVKKAFERLDLHKIQIEPVCWYRDCAEFWIVTLESAKDYYTLYDYLKVCERMWDVNIDKPDAYPCTITIALDEDYASDYCGNLKEELKEALQKLEETGKFNKYKDDGVKTMEQK